MKVYHGSYIRIDNIDLLKCKPQKDFGQGFYVTKYLRHAENWARVVAANNSSEAVITEFEYMDDEFTNSICKIKRFDGYSEEWLDFIVMNRDRKSPNPAHDYDIVEGPVADDKIQNTLRFFLKGKVSKEKFLEMLTYHEETHRICFLTLNSLQAIESVNDTSTIDLVRISQPLLEKLMLDKTIDENLAADIFYTSQTFADLADKSTGLYLKDWEEVYEMLEKELKTSRSTSE